MFEPNVIENVRKKKLTNFKFKFFLIINNNIIFNFEKEWCTFGMEIFFWKK